MRPRPRIGPTGILKFQAVVHVSGLRRLFQSLFVGFFCGLFHQFFRRCVQPVGSVLPSEQAIEQAHSPSAPRSHRYHQTQDGPPSPCNVVRAPRRIEHRCVC